jgi:hypothetical protein
VPKTTAEEVRVSFMETVKTVKIEKCKINYDILRALFGK